ncbi:MULTISPECIES: CAP domain-containing protein [Amycolatopsis]|uniref:Cysteine-rich secretory protein family protein n=2 Tax=Amycolatopsis TaxID=1813 RepID=A0A1I3TV26_9PSEU|nr:Cysteine-rich secretory protein family protein [Amycolatopsis sacchari]
MAPDTSVAGQVLALVNQERAKAGCGALAEDSRLDTAAQKFSEDMSARDYFAHSTPEGVTFDQRIKAAGYPSPAAENIAKGSTTAAQTMQMWMNSDGHRRNILNCSYQKLGVGLDKDGWYWVQDFGF